MKLNCDLGEGFGAHKGPDSEIMPFIHQASIACGFHAGDPIVIQASLKLAKENGVSVGAHPAYPDLSGFGRRSMQCSEQEIIALMHYQVAALEGMAKCEGLSLSYVKPHGALYNDMMAKPEVRLSIFKAMAAFHQPLPLMMQAGEGNDKLRKEAAAFGLVVWFEAFADRRYRDDGGLVSRRTAGAMLEHDEAVEQVRCLLKQGYVVSESGNPLALHADSLCVHGDGPDAINMVKVLQKMLSVQ